MLSYNGLLGNVFSSVYHCEPQTAIFHNISNAHEDMRLCMMENVLSSVVLIAAIFEIILAFSQYLKNFR